MYQGQVVFTQIMVHSPKKTLRRCQSLHYLRIIDTTLFENIPLFQSLTNWEHKTESVDWYKQLTLFSF